MRYYEKTHAIRHRRNDVGSSRSKWAMLIGKPPRNKFDDEIMYFAVSSSRAENRNECRTGRVRGLSAKFVEKIRSFPLVG